MSQTVSSRFSVRTLAPRLCACAFALAACLGAQPAAGVIGVTVNGTDISGSGADWTYSDSTNLVLSGKGPYVISGNNGGNTVSIQARADCTVVASNLTVNVSSKDYVTAFDCGTHAVTLALWSDAGQANTFISGYDCAGVAVVSNGTAVASLTITNLNEAAALSAQGGWHGAGIGGGFSNTCGRVTISGGTVAAAGGTRAAGIGGGWYGAGGTVTISGGRITATGGGSGAGIGGGWNGAGGMVTISGGTVVASCGTSFGAEDIGRGYGATSSGANTFTGGSVLLAHDALSPLPSDGAARVWEMTFTNVTSAAALADVTNVLASRAPGYGRNGIVAVDGKVCAWLTNGVTTVMIGGATYPAGARGVTVNGIDIGDHAGAGWTYDGRFVALTGAGPFVISGNNGGNAVSIRADGNCTVVASNLTMDVSGTGGYVIPGVSAFDCGTHAVTLELWSDAGMTNVFKSGYNCAGIRTTDGSLAITNLNESAVLFAEGGESGAGIGGGDGDDGGTVIISGGNVTAQGGLTSAGIGGGKGYGNGKGNGGTVTISGGTVTAIGGQNGAGIGGGMGMNNGSGGAGGTVIISGGTVSATGGTLAAGIGGGDHGNGGTVTISGGIVSATGGLFGAGAGIGGGYGGNGGTVVISGGTVSATGADGGGGAGIGGGEHGNGGPVTISGGTVTAIGGDSGAGIGGGMGDNEGNGGAGGTVTISGGTVKAVGNFCGAGIGGGEHGNGGTVTISGGTVVATGNIGGAGIGGGGYNGNGGTVTISGGRITAIGNSDKNNVGGAGIGGGAKGAGGTVAISGGTVMATGNMGGAGIGGGGINGNGGTVAISGGTVVASGDKVVEFDGTVHVPEDIGYGAKWGSSHLVSSGTNTFTGGSISLSHGSISNAPVNATRAYVYCVTFTNATDAAALADITNALVKLSPAYGVNGITNLDGNVYAWLPNGPYEFEIGGQPWRVTVNNGAATVEPVVSIRNVTARQRYPWNGKVDIDFEVTGGAAASNLVLAVTASNTVAGTALPVRTLAMGGTTLTNANFSLTGGTWRVTWDAGADAPDVVSSNVAVSVAGWPLYLVADLSGGTGAAAYPLTALDAAPAGGWTDEYKTTKLVLRRIEPGTFTMGSPAGEADRGDDETQHPVTLTTPFYIGVFEFTQRQWELVMGNKPSYFTTDYATRPVEQVSYDDIRGNSAGTNWPSSSAVDATSFMGKLRAKTGLGFDLPTEAQWEYACRAGTTNSYNNGSDDTNTLAVLAWYSDNSSDATHAVGQKAPNAWGLYDMHGNVWEWNLDWYWDTSSSSAVTDPVGAPSGDYRVLRGGSWGTLACYSRSAWRSYYYSSLRNFCGGFRPALAVGPVARSGGAASIPLVAASPSAVALDTRPGARPARAEEPIAFGTRWGAADAGSCAVTVKDPAGRVSTLTNVAVSAEGTVLWHVFADDPLPGVYTLTHTAGGETLTASFSSPAIGVKVDGYDIGAGSGAGWTYDRTNLVLSGTDPYVISGSNGASIVSIRARADCTVVASNLTVDVSGKDGVTAFDCNGRAVTLELDGTNVFTSGNSCAGIQTTDSLLAITNLNDAAALSAQGGEHGAGIGGGRSGAGGTVTILGGTVTATGGSDGAGIGGGGNGAGGTVTISGGTVVAKGENGAEDIGHGRSGSSSGANTFIGGSILPVNGSVSLVPSNGTTMVSVAVASGYAPGERVTSFPAWLPAGYGTDSIYADASGAVYLWIPGVEVTYDAAGGVFAGGSTLVTNVSTAATGYVLPSATFFAHRLAGWQAEDGTPVTNGMPLLSYAAHTLSARWETFFCAADTNAVSACGGGSCGAAACPLLCACKTSAKYDGFLYEAVTVGTSTVQAVTGLLTVDIRKSGSGMSVRATVKAGSAKVPFNNLVSVDGCAVTLASGSGEVLSLSFAGDRVSGTLAAGSRLATPAAVDGARNRYKDKSDAAAQALGAKIAGTYTAAMALGDSACTGPRDIRPAGYGCLAVKITSLGKVSVLGRLPDGTSVSCSTAALAYDGCGAGEVLLPFLGAKGALGGLLLLDADAKTLSSGADFGWAFLWRRAAKADDGFDALLDAAGGAYAKPSDTAALTFTGDFSSLPEYWLKGSGHAFDAALLPENVAVTRAGAKFTAGANGAKLRLKLTLSNGLVAGGFTAYAQVDGRARAKSVKLYGALLQPAAGAGASPAFFGAALLRDDDPAVKTSRAVRSAPVWME